MENFHGTVIQVLDGNHYAVIASWGSRVEAVCYREGLQIDVGYRVFVELARESNLWLIADATNASTGWSGTVGTTPTTPEPPSNYALYFTGMLTASGAASFKRTLRLSLAAALSFAGIITKSSVRRLTGALTSTGSFIASVPGFTVTGILAMAGSLSQVISRTLTATLTSIGTLVRSISLTGTLTLSGALAQSRNRLLSGTLGMAAAITLSIQRTLTGTLTSSSVLDVQESGGVAASGTLTMAGTLTLQVSRTLTATLALAGALSVPATEGAFAMRDSALRDGDTLRG